MTRTLRLLALLVLGSSLPACYGARILGVFPIPSRSHLTSFTALTKELAQRGHQVTLITAEPMEMTVPNENHRVIAVGNALHDVIFSDNSNFFTSKLDPLSWQSLVWNLGEILVNSTLSHPEYQRVVNTPGQNFDLILAEVFFYQEALLGLSHKFDAPMIALHPFGTAFWIGDVTGNPVNPSWVPNPILGYTDHMTFYERLVNTAFAAYQKVGSELFHFPRQQSLLEKFFPGAPPLKQLLKERLALTFVNNHHSLFYPAPIAPNVVEVGGMHISEGLGALPSELQEFCDGAKAGVVLFSMGSSLRMVQLPESTKNALIGAFGALKQRVIMKWDGPSPQNLPSNVRLESWVPQADLLRHKNMRLFVTHGGLLSTQEAAFHGVPIIGIPIFGDQFFNMRLAQHKGFALQLNLDDITQENLSQAFQEVLGDPKYGRASKRISAIFRSQPVPMLERAVFWTEHVLEHGGDHLQPACLDLAWYNLFLLDLAAACLAPVIAVALLCRSLLCRKRNDRRTAPLNKNKIS